MDLGVFFYILKRNHSGSVTTMWGPQTIAKLVNITPISLWFMDVYGPYNELVTGLINQQTSLGGPHCIQGTVASSSQDESLGGFAPAVLHSLGKAENSGMSDKPLAESALYVESELVSLASCGELWEVREVFQGICYNVVPPFDS